MTRKSDRGCLACPGLTLTSTGLSSGSTSCTYWLCKCQLTAQPLPLCAVALYDHSSYCRSVVSRPTRMSKVHPRNSDPYHHLSCDHQRSPLYGSSTTTMTSRPPEGQDTLAPIPSLSPWPYWDNGHHGNIITSLVSWVLLSKQLSFISYLRRPCSSQIKQEGAKLKSREEGPKSESVLQYCLPIKTPLKEQGPDSC